MARLFDDAIPHKIEYNGIGPVTAEPMTLAGWCNPDVAGLTMVLCGVGSGATQNGVFRIGVTNSNLAFAQRQEDIGSVNALALGTSAPALNQWQHVAGTFTFSAATTATVYYNGVVEGSNTTGVGVTSSNRTSIGITPGQVGAGLRAWSGSLAEIGMWNVALTAPEIAALAKGYTPMLIRPTALQFYASLVRDILDVRGGRALTATGTSVSVHPRVDAAAGGL